MDMSASMTVFVEAGEEKTVSSSTYLPKWLKKIEEKQEKGSQLMG
jgi:hypothetical protein